MERSLAATLQAGNIYCGMLAHLWVLRACSITVSPSRLHFGSVIVIIGHENAGGVLYNLPR